MTVAERFIIIEIHYFTFYATAWSFTIGYQRLTRRLRVTAVQSDCIAAFCCVTEKGRFFKLLVDKSPDRNVVAVVDDPSSNIDLWNALMEKMTETMPLISSSKLLLYLRITSNLHVRRVR